MTSSIHFIGQFDYNDKPEQDQFKTAYNKYTEFLLNIDLASGICYIARHIVKQYLIEFHK